MFDLGRWLTAWACLGMLLYPAAPTSAAPPSADPAPAADSSGAAPAEPSSAVVEKERRPTAPLDVSYIPAEATAAVIVHPQTLLTGPNAEWMPVEIITAAGRQQFGVDPVRIQEAVVFLIPPPAAAPNADPAFGVILRFTRPYDKAALLAKLPEGKQIDEAGKTFYQLTVRDKECIYLPDDRTIIYSVRETLLRMFAAQDVDSPLVKLLRKTDCSGTFTALVSFDGMRDLLTSAMTKMPPMPPPFEQFRKTPQLISSVKIRVDIVAGADVDLTLHAVDEQAAAELLDLTNNAMLMGRQAVLFQIRQGMGKVGDDPVQQASAKFTTRIVNNIFDLVKPVRMGSNVKVSVHTDSGPAVIGVLVALLLPAVQAARDAARRNQSLSMMKEIGLALLNHENAFSRFPQRAICDPQGKPLLSWRVKVLPYLEESALYKEFHLDEAWDSPHNKPLIAKIPRIYCNPGRPIDGKTNYLVPVGPEVAFESKLAAYGGRRLEEITDGTSNTIMLVEADEDRAVIWTKPDDLQVNLDKPLAGLSNFRPNGFYAVFFDIHGQLIPKTLDPQVVKALFTIAGGENVQSP